MYEYRSQYFIREKKDLDHLEGMQQESSLQRVAKQNSAQAPPAVRWFLDRLNFYPDDGVNTFLRNVHSHTDYTALYSRRWQHSKLLL
jgi:hypothetical protein